MQSVWAVVVARVGNGAKSRLAGVLDPAQRRALALAMLSDVLAACARAELAGTLAVVDEPAARQIVEHAGASAVADPGTGGMNAAAAAGVSAARQRGATAVIIIPGDVPLLTPADFELLVSDASDAPRVVVVGASRDGHGTNALLLRPPDVIVPAFGPPSVDRHVQAGLAAGALARVRAGLALALDIDTPDDLAALASSDGGPHTAAALAQLLEQQALVGA